MLASITLPLVYVVPDADERGEPATLWNAVPQVVLAEASDFGDGDTIGVATTIARIALVLLGLLLLGSLEGVRQGLDAGAGLWAPLVVALVLLVPSEPTRGG